MMEQEWAQADRVYWQWNVSVGQLLQGTDRQV
jgi:hypothetical protein